MNIVQRTRFPPGHPGDLPDSDIPVVALATDAARPGEIPRHHHFRAQLVHAIEGVMAVVTDSGNWVVPPGQAVWMPAGVEHEVRWRGRLSLRSLYVHPDRARALSGECRVVAVSPLLRELIVRAASWERAAPAPEHRARLAALVLDELEALDAAPLHLPLPRDTRLREITESLLADPADARPLGHWSRSVGASSRTLARLFARETGMSFSSWRRRLRLVEAVARLGAGQPVTRVAYDLGYQSPSAFVAMFRRTLGAPPSRYLRADARPTRPSRRQ